MSSVPESALHIEDNLREENLTDSEQYLYDQFARAYIECLDQTKAALAIGFNYFVANEWGFKIYNSGFTQRRIAHLLDAPVPDAERAGRLNRAFRITVQHTMNADPKVALTACANIHKINDAIEDRKRLYGDGKDSNIATGGVMVVPVGPDTLDGWGKACEASQASMQLEIDKDNATRTE